MRWAWPGWHLSSFRLGPCILGPFLDVQQHFRRHFSLQLEDAIGRVGWLDKQ